MKLIFIMKTTSKIFALTTIFVSCWLTFRLTKKIVKSLKEIDLNEIDFS